MWTPAGSAGPRPVLLWLHGGGFTSGSGWDWYGGARLAGLGDIVVVTANYRLGPLGYLYLPQIGAENLGSQDQAAALRWVTANIAAFGGDPANITVGSRPGAFSALALAGDPATRWVGAGDRAFRSATVTTPVVTGRDRVCGGSRRGIRTDVDGISGAVERGWSRCRRICRCACGGCNRGIPIHSCAHRTAAKPWSG
ncbi:carboxylesterase family protein [Nocardia uniformis]|uniref:carboxylesterase family protein n=1 Tax=Nocardia uniformis TaxID=53432 RepID=UPI000AA1E388|nr:carboxylesterase family protein [Nocardia uniformis]